MGTAETAALVLGIVGMPVLLGFLAWCRSPDIRLDALRALATELGLAPDKNSGGGRTARWNGVLDGVALGLSGREEYIEMTERWRFFVTISVELPGPVETPFALRLRGASKGRGTGRDDVDALLAGEAGEPAFWDRLLVSSATRRALIELAELARDAEGELSVSDRGVLLSVETPIAMKKYVLAAVKKTTTLAKELAERGAPIDDA